MPEVPNMEVPEAPGVEVLGVTAPEAVDWSAVLDRVSCLRGRDVGVEELPGGLTNLNLRVTEVPSGVPSEGRSGGLDVVVRCAQPGSELLAIDRYAEHLNTRAAAQAGVGAPVIEHVPAEPERPGGPGGPGGPDDPGGPGAAERANLLVVGFLEGRTFTEDDLTSRAHLDRVAEACRRLHAGPAFVGTFDMFAIQQRYLRLVTDRGFRLPADYEEHAVAVDRVRRAFAAATDKPPAVPCHNDLLAANFIDSGDRLWLIDYEYAGTNDPYFELGNIAAEAGLDEDQLAALVTAYDRTDGPDRAHLARARLWGAVARYGWTLWGSIQDATSTLDFDFWGWGMHRYDLARAAFTDRGFGRLLDEAAGRA